MILDFNENTIEKVSRELSKIAKNKIDMMVVDDIVDIYNGKYTDYSQYVQIKQEQRNVWQENFRKPTFENKSVFFYELEPVILSLEVFNYAKSRKKEEK